MDAHPLGAMMRQKSNQRLIGLLMLVSIMIGFSATLSLFTHSSTAHYEVRWNGNSGRTSFFQNEMPYDSPNQAAWMNGSINGYAAHKVADLVTSHEVWGVGSYCYFNVNLAIVADHAFEVSIPGNTLPWEKGVFHAAIFA